MERMWFSCCVGVRTPQGGGSCWLSGMFEVSTTAPEAPCTGG